MKFITVIHLSLSLLLLPAMLSAQGNLVLNDRSGNVVVLAIELIESGDQETIKMTRDGPTPSVEMSNIPLVGNYRYDAYKALCQMLLDRWSDIDLSTQEKSFEFQLLITFEARQARENCKNA